MTCGYTVFIFIYRKLSELGVTCMRWAVMGYFCSTKLFVGVFD